MPSDDDILSQLEEIDVAQIAGEEIPLDESLDLDFEDEGVPLKPRAPAQETRLAGSEIRIGVDGRANQPAPPVGGPKAVAKETGPAAPAAKPKATGQARAESGQGPKKTKAPPARAEPKAAAVAPAPPQAIKLKFGEEGYEDPRKPGAAVSDVQEMVLHAKLLRIVADTVVIEPRTVSISS